MSLNKKKELYLIARELSRNLRNNPTDAEKILWSRLKNKLLNNKIFLRQHPLFHDITGKEGFFIADFYCKEKRLIIELDGEYHKHKLHYDANRTSILNYLGLKVIRFKNDDIIYELDKVLAAIMIEVL